MTTTGFRLQRVRAPEAATCQQFPPLRMYVDPKVRPVVCNKPGNIPLHLQAEVKKGLGVLCKVPLNAPLHSYLQRMVKAKKRTGKVRKTVNLKPLSRACPQQTHAVEPPFLQASGVPVKSWKTCLDAK